MIYLSAYDLFLRAYSLVGLYLLKYSRPHVHVLPYALFQVHSPCQPSSAAPWRSRNFLSALATPLEHLLSLPSITPDSQLQLLSVTPCVLINDSIGRCNIRSSPLTESLCYRLKSVTNNAMWLTHSNSSWLWKKWHQQEVTDMLPSILCLAKAGETNSQTVASNDFSCNRPPLTSSSSQNR